MPRQESRDGYPVRSRAKERGARSTRIREHQYRGGNDIVAAELRTILGGDGMSGEQWFVGVDWGSEQHQICVLEGDGKVVGERQVAHSGDGIADLCTWLDKLSGGHLESVHAAIEMPHGAVVEMLLERRVQVYAINPKQLDRFRDRFTVAGAKDDRRDARVLADSLRTDRRSFRHLQVEAPEVIELREWSRMREELKQDRNRLINRLREQLRRYYPQMLELGGDLGAAWFLELWEKAPTPAEAARIRKASIAAILKRNRIRRHDAAGVLHILRQQPLQVSRGTTAAAKAHIESVIIRLRPVTELIDQAHARLDELIAEIVGNDDSTEREEQRDVSILRSMPGIGRIVLATLLAEATQALTARDYHTLRILTGVAPVTWRSGKKCVVMMRRACNKRLRDAMYHWARVAIQHDAASRERYAELRGRGQRHGRALRTVSDRLLRVACAMLRDRTRYDPQHRTARATA